MYTECHLHTTFCDGRNTPEEIVQYAMEQGLDGIGFSGHGYTSYDEQYCIKDMDVYIKEISRLKRAYDFPIYLGVEEDAFAPVERPRYDYIIGSCHYIKKDGAYFPIDSDYEGFSKILDAFDGDALALAHRYFDQFCAYIHSRKPDIIGHFDLITKFDEKYDSVFLENRRYMDIAKGYISMATEADCIFEVNTGAMARGLRTSPYPSEELLFQLKCVGGKVMLSSDCHDMTKLAYRFNEMHKYLRDIGFTEMYTMSGSGFVRESI